MEVVPVVPATKRNLRLKSTAQSEAQSLRKLLDHLGLRMDELQHLQHEMPVPPGTEVTEEIKAEYCPWWYMPGG